MMLPVEVRLQKPVSYNGEDYEVLHFDEPTLDSQLAFLDLEPSLEEMSDNRKGVVALRFWIQWLADVPRAVAGKIRPADMPAIEAAIDAALGIKNRAQDEAAAVGNGTPQN